MKASGCRSQSGVNPYFRTFFFLLIWCNALDTNAKYSAVNKSQLLLKEMCSCDNCLIIFAVYICD